MMFLRQAAASLLKRTRISSKLFSDSPKTAISPSPTSLSNKFRISDQNCFQGSDWRMDHMDPCLWMVIYGQAAVFMGINANLVQAEGASIESSSGNDVEGAKITGLRKIEDGSVVSNIHTSKWRVFTDNGRDFFLQGKLEEAERFFLSALQEAKEGFGQNDPHVASACNNLAELYRVKKEFNKAEPLYLEAINILENSYGHEDIRVGVAVHNLGQFYLVQRKLEEARVCYERAVKIKQHVLGEDHIDYADTMYHLGMVLYLQGKESDAEALIQDSIRILEGCGQGESISCIRRLKYLAQIYLKSNRSMEAENTQRKILHVMELSKGWNSLDTVNAAEALALTLQSTGNLREAQELFERCLEARKTLLPDDHVQIAANMLHMARMLMLKSNQLRKTHMAEAIVELDKAKDFLDNSSRISEKVLNKLTKQRSKQDQPVPEETRRDVHSQLLILLQSLDALGVLEVSMNELQDSKYGLEKSLSNSPAVKSEYLSCLKHLSALIADTSAEGIQHLSRTNLEDLQNEIKRVEGEISAYKRSKRSSSS
ncbi:uncharacterized protein LOC110825855 isoform X2 [Carica papaya]|uniref:uncharacterized protein LOC110825855 isoform X2 n=1 Tax=Carica papaya TaxID=3649 RepID=UPI000B8CAFC3|nr:uncharacterized protein LOC110825855 isoform X2 [Carica papaya]